MKYDLTKYGYVARQAMAENRKNDKRYTWTIKAINKNSIKFNWSYLSKHEEFVLTVRESAEEPYVLIEFPHGLSKVCFLIGEASWCDAKTLEVGIYKSIIYAADKAQRIF